MANRMQLSVAFERLFLFGASCVLFIHTLGCIWIFLAYENQTNYEPNWIDSFGFEYKTINELYIIAVYFTVTTITTVGYGDIHAYSKLEFIIGIILKIFGVIGFSFASGALSAIIQNLDAT